MSRALAGICCVLSMLTSSVDGFDVGGMTFSAPDSSKPNSGDVANAEQQSLGTLNIHNTPGADMTFTTSMEDIKEKVDYILKNISTIRSSIVSQSASSGQNQVIKTQVNDDVASVASSANNVQETLNSLKTRLDGLKARASTTEGSGSQDTSVQIDQQMTANDETKDNLLSKVPELKSRGDQLQNTLTSAETTLVNLKNLASSLVPTEQRDDLQTVSELEKKMTESTNKMAAMTEDADSVCHVLDTHLMEIQGVNVVEQGPRGLLKYKFFSAISSSKQDGGDAMNALDGSSEVYYYSQPYHCQCTNYEWASDPWLQAQLPALSMIGGVGVLVRADCCYGLSKGVKVETSAKDPYYGKWEACTQTETNLRSATYHQLLCNTFRLTEFVRFTATIASQLSFCEVEALGIPNTDETYAYGMPASQSSTFAVSTAAHFANDNDFSTCAQTLTGSDDDSTWWQVDLMETHFIYAVQITFKESSSVAERSDITVNRYVTFPLTCEVPHPLYCGSTNQSAYLGRDVTVQCAYGYQVRYVKLIREASSVVKNMEICEVKVL